MLAIIQETLKKINRSIGFYHVLSLFITLFLLIIFSFYLYFNKKINTKPLIYNESGDFVENKNYSQNTIFASKNGTTYTFSWCQGANKIKEENKVFFNNEEEAVKSGRRLSKMCGR